MVLPALLWWAIPLGVTAWAVWRLRPAPVSWPFIAFCLFWPPFVARMVAGNPVMWVLAFLALGCLYKWPSALVLLKPSLFPFALIGVRSRSWWIALAVGVLVSLPFAVMRIDWIVALVNSTEGGSVLAPGRPDPLLPIIAWKDALAGLDVGPVASRIGKDQEGHQRHRDSEVVDERDPVQRERHEEQADRAGQPRRDW